MNDKMEMVMDMVNKNLLRKTDKMEVSF